MRFALVDDKREEARPGLEGLCPYCRQKVIAKCGDLRIHHWAHYNNRRKCDCWWESETEWHRSWKNEFPEEWQEVVLIDETSGERHIADVQTEHGVVIEFKDKAGKTSMEGFYFVRFPATCFPMNWIENNVPVVFDFGDTCVEDDLTSSFLYCLLPEKFHGLSIIHRMSRQNFIDKVYGLLNVSCSGIMKTFEERFMSKPLDIRRCVETYARRNRLGHCPPDWLV